MPIEHIREIVRDPVLTEVPRAPSHVLGVMMLRGEVVPVFDLRRKLGLGQLSTPPRASRVVIVDLGLGPAGIVVDTVRQVVRLRDSAIEPTPPGVGGADPESLAGIAREKDRLILLLDLTHVLGVRTA